MQSSHKPNLQSREGLGRAVQWWRFGESVRVCARVCGGGVRADGLCVLLAPRRSWYVFSFLMPWLPETFFALNDWQVGLPPCHCLLHASACM